MHVGSREKKSWRETYYFFHSVENKGSGQVTILPLASNLATIIVCDYAL